MSLEISLESYSGPLELLLQLIEKNKVDIYDIPIALITEQYLESVEAMKEDQDLDTLSDFLLMASTLLDIKARMLLPKEEDENGEEIDPRTELVERLIEYQEYKILAEELRTVYDTDTEPLFRNPSIPDEVVSYRPAPDYDALLSNVTLEKLKDVFLMVLSRKEELADPIRSRFGDIQKDPVRISDKLSHVLETGEKKKRFSFRELLEKQATKQEIVVTFLACLELIKIGQILVSQEDSNAEIELTWNEDCETKISKEDIEDYD